MVESGMYTYIVVDDHPGMRAGVCSFLTQEHNFKVLAEADNGETALHLCEKLQPDLLMLDLNIIGMPGIEVMRKLAERKSKTRVLVLSAYEDIDYIYELMNLGAAGYVLKQSLGHQIVEAARNVMRGQSWMSPQLTGRLFMHKAQQANRPCPEDLLTKREIEILKLIALGLENDEIAERFCLSKNTVQNHTSTIYNKINVPTRAKAIVYAIKHGLLELDKISLEAND